MDTDRVLRRIKLNDLRLLQGVVQQGGMAKAAAHLNLSQPAVSKAIAALEHTIGIRLFDRTSQGIEPTLYCQALLKGSVAVFDDLKQSIKQIEFLADPAAGELRLGCVEPVIIGILPAVIDRLSRRFPRIVVHVAITDSLRLQRDLRARNFELAIGRVEMPVADDLQAEMLCNERLYVVAGTRSPWVRKRSIDLADLMEEQWTLPPPDSIPGTVITKIFRANDLDVPRRGVVAFSIPLHCNLLGSGRFLTILPGFVLRSYRRSLSLKILPVKLSQPPAAYWIVTLKNRTLNPIASPFIDCAREVANLYLGER